MTFSPELKCAGAVFDELRCQSNCKFFASDGDSRTARVRLDLEVTSGAFVLMADPAPARRKRARLNARRGARSPTSRVRRVARAALLAAADHGFAKAHGAAAPCRPLSASVIFRDAAAQAPDRHGPERGACRAVGSGVE
jgi:hypothetical protein